MKITKTKTKTIKLPHGIEVIFNIDNGSGLITSNLHEQDPGNEDPKAMLGMEEQHELSMYNNSIDTLENIILAQARAGVDIESPEYRKSIETVVDALQINDL